LNVILPSGLTVSGKRENLVEVLFGELDSNAISLLRLEEVLRLLREWLFPAR